MINNDIRRIGKLTVGINNLVGMGLLQALTDEPNVYVIPVILQLKDKKYMENWCRNILRVWCLSNVAKLNDKEVDEIEIVVFNKENGDLICRFSEKGGLYFS